MESSLARADEVLHGYAAALKAHSYHSTEWVYIIDNDEPRLIRSAFAKRWQDPETGNMWALVFCEHAEPFCVSLDDSDVRVYTFIQEKGELEEWK